jgi:hypothetical protein
VMGHHRSFGNNRCTDVHTYILVYTAVIGWQLFQRWTGRHRRRGKNSSFNLLLKLKNENDGNAIFLLPSIYINDETATVCVMGFDGIRVFERLRGGGQIIK